MAVACTVLKDCVEGLSHVAPVSIKQKAEAVCHNCLTFTTKLSLQKICIVCCNQKRAVNSCASLRSSDICNFMLTIRLYFVKLSYSRCKFKVQNHKRDYIRRRYIFWRHLPMYRGGDGGFWGQESREKALKYGHSDFLTPLARLTDTIISSMHNSKQIHATIPEWFKHDNWKICLKSIQIWNATLAYTHRMHFGANFDAYSREHQCHALCGM